MQTLETIHTSFPRSLPPYLPAFFSVSLSHLQLLFPTFEKYYISSSSSAPGSSEDDSVDLPQLVCPIIDFTASATRGGKAKEWLDGGEENGGNGRKLIESVVQWAQMTNDDVSGS
jgi:hypothetical protein